MRLGFMGSPDFAVPALRALANTNHEIAVVYTQPPRPAGRGQAVRPSPVQIMAEALGLPVRAPIGLSRNVEVQAEFAALELDLAIVAAYGLILPRAILEAPRRGCLNIHASLLPRWRGAAPIQAAIRAGDLESGVTIMRMDTGLDTGPIKLRQAIPITPATTGASLHDALAGLGAQLLMRTLTEDPPETPQPEGATYAPRLRREDGQIDWSEPAASIERQIRAYILWPGTYARLGTEMLKVLAAKVVETGPAAGLAGSAIDDAMTIACGRGALRLTRVQLSGRAPMEAGAFLNGRKIPAGTRLG